MMGGEPPRMIVIVPGLAIPEHMSFLLELCKPTKHTKRAIEAGHLLRVDYHPPYIQLECRDVERIVEEALRRRLRVYRGRKHITISDGVYAARVYASRG